jgi:hypothetical protein
MSDGAPHRRALEAHVIRLGESSPSFPGFPGHPCEPDPPAATFRLAFTAADARFHPPPGMPLRPLTLALAASIASLGCLSSGSTPNGGQTGVDSGVLDGSFPVQTVDGSVFVDGAVHGAVPGFVTGLGSGQVEHSPSFTLITKTGDMPGGAGVKSSASFHLISGVGASATK